MLRTSMATVEFEYLGISEWLDVSRAGRGRRVCNSLTSLLFIGSVCLFEMHLDR